MKVQVLKTVSISNFEDHVAADLQIYFATLKASGTVVEVYLVKKDSDFEYKLNGAATYDSEMGWEVNPTVETYEIESLRQLIDIEV